MAACIFEDFRFFLQVCGLQIEKAVQLYMITRYYMDTLLLSFIYRKLVPYKLE